MFANFDYDVIIRSLPYLFLDGMSFTLLLTALATAGGIVLGTLLALMRLSGIPPFTLFEAAYFCEIMRAGIQSIPRGQVAAAQALGMTYPQTMGYIVLPQAFRNMLPVLLTQTIILFQDTSLVYVLSITDFLGAASKVAQRDGRLVEMYLFAALVYFVISFVASHGVRVIQRRTAIIR